MFEDSKLDMFIDSVISEVFEAWMVSNELLIFKSVLVTRTIINVGVEIESDNEFESKVIFEVWLSNKIPKIDVDSIFWDDWLTNDIIDDTDWTLSVVVEIESDNECEDEEILKFCESNKIPDNVVDSIFWDDSPANE